MFLNGKMLETATNEIAIMSAKPAKIIQFEVYVEDCILDSMRADGVILQLLQAPLPIMSAGDYYKPKGKCIVIVPVAPLNSHQGPG